MLSDETDTGSEASIVQPALTAQEPDHSSNTQANSDGAGPSGVQIIILILLFLLSVYVWLANPFHLLDQTGSVSDRVANRIYSVLLRPNGKSDVVVVAIDDISVETLGPDTGFPLNFDVHSRLLKGIMCAAPSAIFIDVAFQRIRVDQVSAQTEQDAIERMASAFSLSPSSSDCQGLVDTSAVPTQARNRVSDVFIARRATEAGECVPFAEKDAFGNPCPRMALFKQFGENFKPLTLAREDEYDDQLIYPLYANLTNSLRFRANISSVQQASDEPHTSLAPAMALVMARCEQGLASPSELDVCSLIQSQMTQPDDQDLNGEFLLAPTWRFYRAFTPLQAALAQNASDGPSACRQYQEIGETVATLQKRIKTALAMLIDGAFNEFLSEHKPLMFGETTCSPYPSITADTLLALQDTCASKGQCSELVELFTNKSVVYGYTNQAANDTFVSPVLGHAPGVLLHAAAADSLIEQGDLYWRDSRTFSIFGWECDISSDEISLGLTAMYLLMNLAMYYRPGKAMQIKWGGAFVIVAFAFVVPPLLTLAPIDWVACILFVFVFLPSLERGLTFIAGKLNFGQDNTAIKDGKAQKTANAITEDQLESSATKTN